MAMKRTRTPWMKAGDFGRSLARGIGVNLLVSDMAAMEAFCRDVLGADIIYADEDFAAIELLGSVFMLHADHSYLDNAMTGTIAGAETRGAGVELRLYGANPDAVETTRAITATSCWPGRSTSRTACARAMSSDRTAIYSCQALRWPDDCDKFATILGANPILTISG
ncbi:MULTISPECIES: hypothetical protein [unclassified Mesorhizobium]|uniref:hypothetical protein n=1 Tax=unclassified Mesorhizobium TaxID=325217 RepID=UPI001FEE57DD|nr:MULTISPECIES: hypothetical protein [unclassified Mesorhizobium]